MSVQYKSDTDLTWLKPCFRIQRCNLYYFQKKSHTITVDTNVRPLILQPTLTQPSTRSLRLYIFCFSFDADNIEWLYYLLCLHIVDFIRSKIDLFYIYFRWELSITLFCIFVYSTSFIIIPVQCFMLYCYYNICFSCFLPTVFICRSFYSHYFN